MDQLYRKECDAPIEMIYAGSSANEEARNIICLKNVINTFENIVENRRLRNNED